MSDSFKKDRGGSNYGSLEKKNYKKQRIAHNSASPSTQNKSIASAAAANALYQRIKNSPFSSRGGYLHDNKLNQQQAVPIQGQDKLWNLSKSEAMKELITKHCLEINDRNQQKHISIAVENKGIKKSNIQQKMMQQNSTDQFDKKPNNSLNLKVGSGIKKKSPNPKTNSNSQTERNQHNFHFQNSQNSSQQKLINILVNQTEKGVHQDHSKQLINFIKKLEDLINHNGSNSNLRIIEKINTIFEEFKKIKGEIRKLVEVLDFAILTPMRKISIELENKQIEFNGFFAQSRAYQEKIISLESEKKELEVATEQLRKDLIGSELEREFQEKANKDLQEQNNTLSHLIDQIQNYKFNSPLIDQMLQEREKLKQMIQKQRKTIRESRLKEEKVTKLLYFIRKEGINVDQIYLKYIQTPSISTERESENIEQIQNASQPYENYKEEEDEENYSNEQSENASSNSQINVNPNIMESGDYGEEQSSEEEYIPLQRIEVPPFEVFQMQQAICQPEKQFKKALMQNSF